MARPAFIYAFDNLSPYRFAELCGFLLAERYKGFLLGGVGPDGGIDGEIDNILGVWSPETESSLENHIIQSGQLVVFQFKHKVVGRIGGQAKARQELLTLYKGSSKKSSELKRDLIVEKKPDVYVLVTNVEINANFRHTFIQECRKVNSSIKSYQIVGLDELELWVTMNKNLRHFYFPTIFGIPRFHLDIQLNLGFIENTDVLIVSILNIGESSSYLHAVDVKIIVENEIQKFLFNPYNIPLMATFNPKPGTIIEPGRKLSYYFPLDVVRDLLRKHHAFPIEIVVTDEIDNTYRVEIDSSLREQLLR